MCGIAGILDFDAPIPPDVVPRMTAAIAHRGPDGEGYYADRHVSFGCRRLAIVDVAGGHQPTHNEDGTLHVALNGEIYNHRELRRDLASRGHRFLSHSDAEVIPHLYEDLGLSFVDRLDGDFALIIWDARNETLVLARDPVGVKPLYYYTRGGTLIFASEMKAIHASGRCAASIDPQGLRDSFWYGQTVAPGTFWSGIRDQVPGTVLQASRRGLAETRYYTPLERTDSGKPLLRGARAIEMFAHTFTEAVRKRLPDEVNPGACLSGGIDSTAVAAVAARLTDRPLPTYTIRLPGETLDEGQYSRYAAQHLGLENTEIPITGSDVCALLPKTLWHVETPQWFGVAPPFLALSRYAKESGVTVALTGDGADELLGGYDFYRVQEMHRLFTGLQLGWLHPPVWKQASRWMGAPAGFSQHVVDVHAKEPAFRQHFGEVPTWIYVWSAMSDVCARLFGGTPLPPSRLPDPPDHDRFRRSLHFEYVTRLPNWVLLLSDRLSMANGIEVRVPFMDRALLDLCTELSPDMLMRHGIEKYVLKRALSSVLPPRVRRRRKKPFFTPVAPWYLSGAGQEMAHHYLSEATVRQAALFDPRGVTAVWQTALSRAGTWEGMVSEWATLMVMSTHMLAEQFTSQSTGWLASRA